MRPKSGKRYYQVLGVAKDATPAEVKNAYRALAKHLHPDRLRDPEAARRAEERLKEVNAAWSEYCALQKHGGEGPGRQQARHRTGHAGARPRHADAGDEPSHEGADERAYAAARRGARSSRDRYRAERVREHRERTDRERRAYERAERVRRERERSTRERRERERELLRRLAKAGLVGAAALFAMFLVVLVALALAS
jgi:curved DNA-binding protein CbpA